MRIGRGVINGYLYNSHLKTIYEKLINEYTGIINIISMVYMVNWSGLSLSDNELYSLLTLMTHIIIRYIHEKEEEGRSKNIEIFKHVLPDRIITIWQYAYEILSKNINTENDPGFNMSSWLQILWLNNFTLTDGNMSKNSIKPIFMINDNSIDVNKQLDFIQRLIYLEASSDISTPELEIKREEWVGQMIPQLYELMVINPYKLMSNINLRKFPEMENILKNIHLRPQLQPLALKFYNVIPRTEQNDSFNVDEIPIAI
jgi:hypothetical protein